MDSLISVDELVARGADTIVLDVRWRLVGPPACRDYETGHLPGAAFVDLDADLAASPNSHGRHPLPSAADFQTAMRRCGVSANTPVVYYDFADATSAARAWWLLRYFGHDDVQVLDGGYAAWVVAGGEVSDVDPAPRDGNFIATPGHHQLLTASDAQNVARTGLLLDARARERYTGEDEPVDPVAGHIPGALSAPTLANVLATGHFLGAGQLRARFERLGVTPKRRTGAYCGSGVTAAHEVLALQLAGFSAALYADSWSGWITDQDRPIATGDAPG
ncbi:MAG: sulfurtransferase [Nocardioidaceae bacterium]